MVVVGGVCVPVLLDVVASASSIVDRGAVFDVIVVQLWLVAPLSLQFQDPEVL